MLYSGNRKELGQGCRRTALDYFLDCIVEEALRKVVVALFLVTENLEKLKENQLHVEIRLFISCPRKYHLQNLRKEECLMSGPIVLDIQLNIDQSNYRLYIILFLNLL